MLKNAADLTTNSPSKGLNTNKDILGIDPEQSPNLMNVLIDFDGSSQKRLGSNTQNSVIITNSAGNGFSPNTSNLTNNLISYWNLNEASSTRFDSIGTNNLSDGNSIGQAGGIKNQAASLIASNSNYLLAEQNSTLNTGDIDFSLSTWVYLSSTSTSQRRIVLSKRDGNANFTIDPGGVDTRTVLMLHLNGANGSTTFTDSVIGTPKVFNASGNAQIDTTQSKFGGASLSLTGNSGNWIYTPNSSDFDFPSDFTVDFWLRFNDLDGANLMGNGFATGWSLFWSSNQLNFFNAGTSPLVKTWVATTGQWYNVVLVRSSADLRFYIDGSSIGSVTYSNSISSINELRIGNDVGASGTLDGNIDEVRISKGVARFTQNFTSPVLEYVPVQNLEYSLYIDTDNVVAFSASSSGFAFDGTVRATSFGALTTSTWYNLVAWHDTGNRLGVSVNLSVNTASYSSGLRSGSAPFVLGAASNGTNGFLDGRIDETGFWKTLLNSSNRIDLYNSGNGNTIQQSFGLYPWASFDFGAGGNRWLTVSAGTGIYASSNLGVSFVTIATDRSANYQYLQRSKNVLVATSDSFDTPLYWAGSVGTFAAILNNSAPSCKYSINFNGFLILLNSSSRKRGFFYEDENTQLTGSWSSSFDLPSNQDDEITSAFILRRYLYVSTKYYLYRVNYIGGNPDFSYIQIKDWGFVPRTVKPLYIDGVGQIIIGMSWDKKIRLFDGSDDKIISGPVEEYNGQCDFSMNNVSTSGSGLTISFAETDYNKNIYKLCVSVGPASTQTTHFINFDGRSQAFYPYDQMKFNTMVMAESAGIRYLMAFDRSGLCHMMDSGNLDSNSTPINDILDSSIKFDKSPSQTHKSHRTDLFFENTTSGTIYYFDRIDFQNSLNLRESFIISGSDKVFQIYKSIDVPEAYNTYQYRITTSSGTSSPWRLNRDDHFTQGMGIGKNE